MIEIAPAVGLLGHTERRTRGQREAIIGVVRVIRVIRVV